MRVSVGAWIDKNAERNERELRAAIDLARKNRNIDSIVVGNETIYRGEQIRSRTELSEQDADNLVQEESGVARPERR